MKRLEINYSLGAMDTLVSLARYNFVNRTINDKNREFWILVAAQAMALEY